MFEGGCSIGSDDYGKDECGYALRAIEGGLFSMGEASNDGLGAIINGDGLVFVGEEGLVGLGP